MPPPPIRTIADFCSEGGLPPELTLLKTIEIRKDPTMSVAALNVVTYFDLLKTLNESQSQNGGG